MRYKILLLLFCIAPVSVLAGYSSIKNTIFRWTPRIAAGYSLWQINQPNYAAYQSYAEKQDFLRKNPENIVYNPEKTHWAHQQIAESDLSKSGNFSYVATHNQKVIPAWGAQYGTIILMPETVDPKESALIQLFTQEAHITNNTVLTLNKARLMHDLIATTTVTAPLLGTFARNPAAKFSTTIARTIMSSTLPTYAHYLMAKPFTASLSRKQTKQADAMAIAGITDPTELEKHAAWLRKRDYWENTSLYALSAFFSEKFVNTLYTVYDTTRYKERAKNFENAAKELREKQTNNSDKK